MDETQSTETTVKKTRKPRAKKPKVEAAPERVAHVATVSLATFLNRSKRWRGTHGRDMVPLMNPSREMLRRQRQKLSGRAYTDGMLGDFTPRPSGPGFAVRDYRRRSRSAA